MSYDIFLHDPRTCDVAKTPMIHGLGGGTQVLGGTRDAWLNVTYNYSAHFEHVLGKKGIRTIYGMTGRDSLPILQAAIDKLGTDESEDYWKPTEGNAQKALIDLATLAMRLPYCVWDGD